MGDTTTMQGQQPATNTGLANAFLNNGPLPQTYSPMPMPSAPASSYSSLAAPGSLPGLTGSLIGSGTMPTLPKPSGPMPIPAPIVPAPAAAATPINAHMRWGTGGNIRSDGTTSFGGVPGNVTGGKPLTAEQMKQRKMMGGPMYAGGR